MENVSTAMSSEVFETREGFPGYKCNVSDLNFQLKVCPNIEMSTMQPSAFSKCLCFCISLLYNVKKVKSFFLMYLHF